MDELRLVRREDRVLIVATEAGEEFRLIVDDSMLAEVKQISRSPIDPGKASPREIQAMVRAGKSRTEIADHFGVDPSTIERYEEPVLAERRYILERAQAVPVRASQLEGEEQVFGIVIAERLIGLAAEDAVWSSWRDEEAGWMIGLEFTSHEIDHRAVWSFDHRKSVLAPITPDAVTLSKQGEVGDRLIPKLRAVDDHRGNERFDSGAFDPDRLASELDAPAEETESESPRTTPLSSRVSPDHPSTGSIPIIDMESELARRRIDERAVKTPEPDLPDLGQTADLLDALRRRRGERDSGRLGDESESTEADHGSEQLSPPVQLPGLSDHELEESTVEERPLDGAAPDATGVANETRGGSDTEPRKARRRPQIPSWDDILFGTRSEEDPS